MQYILDVFNFEKMSLTTCINRDVFSKMINSSNTLKNNLLYIDSIIDRLTIIGSTKRSCDGTSSSASWSTCMMWLFSTIPCTIMNDILLHNLRWPIIPKTIASLHMLYNDIIRWGYTKKSITIVLNIIRKQWITMKPSIEHIHSLNVSSSKGSFGITVDNV